LKLVVAAALLIGASACAQDAQVPIQQEPADTSGTSSPSDYGGPAILTRGGGPSISRSGDLVRLRPFITLNGVYDSGLGTTIINPQGNVPYQDGYGIETMFGVAGAHSWQDSELDLDYRGSLRHYTQNSYYDGMDNSLMLSYKRKITSKTTLLLSENVARYARAFSLPLAGYYNTGFEAYDPSFSGLTTNAFFDTPTFAFLSTARLVRQLSPRLSVSIGANAYFVRRHSSQLIGSNGYTALADMAYRLTRYQTISLGYSYSHFDFQNRYGQSDLHNLALGYSIRLGRFWEVALLGGAFRVESNRNTQVQLDPVIAAILGQTFGIQKFYQVSYVPRFGAHITRSFRHAGASLAYNRTVLAGNGIYTTSSYESANFGYSYMGFRRLSLQAGATYSMYSSMMLALGRYHNFSVGTGFGYLLSRGVSLIGRIDDRHYSVQSSNLNRTYYRALLGFGWSPGEYPLALW
jgi:hypothetical protein